MIALCTVLLYARMIVFAANLQYIIVIYVVADDEPRARQVSRLSRISRSIVSHNSLLKIFTKSGDARLDPTKSKSPVQPDRIVH